MSYAKASKIARTAFIGKVDMAGRPYILHLLKVAQEFDDNEDLRIVAILHDLLEDCPEWTEQRLSECFKPEVVAAVVAITKLPGEDYQVYLNRVKQNAFAALVKVEDLKDDMDISRFKRPLKDKDFERLRKYHNAYLFLINQS